MSMLIRVIARGDLVSDDHAMRKRPFCQQSTPLSQKGFHSEPILKASIQLANPIACVSQHNQKKKVHQAPFQAPSCISIAPSSFKYTPYSIAKDFHIQLQKTYCHRLLFSVQNTLQVYRITIK